MAHGDFWYLYSDNTCKPCSKGKPPKDAIRVPANDPRLVKCSMRSSPNDAAPVTTNVPAPCDKCGFVGAHYCNTTPQEEIKPVEKPANVVEAYFVLDHDGVKRYEPAEYEKLIKA